MRTNIFTSFIKKLGCITMLIGGLAGNAVQAQSSLYINSGGALYMPSGSYVFVTGSFGNASSLLVNGTPGFNQADSTVTLEVKQHIYNYTSGTVFSGLLNLTGGNNLLPNVTGVQQTIGGSNGISVNKLVTNNTNNFYVDFVNTTDNSLAITGTHTFTNGVIYTADSTAIDGAGRNYVFYTSTGTFSGDGDGKNISGWVKEQSPHDYTFPVGSDDITGNQGNVNRERTPSIVYVTNGTANTVFAAKYWMKPEPYTCGGCENSGTYNGGLTGDYAFAPPNDSLGQYLRNMNISEYWEIEHLNTGGSETAEVQLLYGGPVWAQGITFASTIEPVHYNATTSLWENVGSTARSNTAVTGGGTGWIISYQRSSFSPYAIADQYDAVLSINYLSFNAAIYNAEYNKLTWAVGAPQAISYFEVEYSLDGNNFTDVGRIAALASQSSYSFMHAAPPAPVVYYRIKGIENSGQVNYTTVKQVVREAANSNIKVYPNLVAANQNINIVFSNAPTGNYTIQLVDMWGKIIHTQQENVEAYDTKLVSRLGFAAGVYYIKIINNSSSTVAKVVLQ